MPALLFTAGLPLLWGMGILLTGGYRFGIGSVPAADTQAMSYLAGVPLLFVIHPWFHRSAWAMRLRWRFTCAFSLFFLAFMIGTVLDDAFVSVLFACLWSLVAVHLWALSGRSAKLRIAASPLLLLSLAAFGVELCRPSFGARSVVWGRAETFSTLFPLEPPYIEEGGRLQPQLDVYMRSRELPQGARLITNSVGLRNEEEISSVVAPGELRVLSLGDSFSVGMQVEQHAFFGAQLERRLEEARGESVTVLNAEVSDPAYGYYFFQEHAPGYRPGVVVLGLCGNDLLQTDAALGEGRVFGLDETGQLMPRFIDKRSKTPIELYIDFAYPEVAPMVFEAAQPRRFWRTYRYWMQAKHGALRWFGKFCRFRVFSEVLPVRWVMDSAPVKMHSLVWDTERKDGHMRLFDGTTNLGFFYKGENPYAEPIYAKFFELIQAYDRCAEARDQRFVLVIFPQRFQVHAEDWAAIRDFWNLAEDDFDLESYNQRIRTFCEQNDILCCDLLQPFREVASERKLYLPEGDIHFNAAGHELAARKVAEFLLAQGVR